jgi:hypothetical protein
VVVFKILVSIAIIMLVAADASLAPEAMPVLVLSPKAALKGDRLDIGLRSASCALSHHDSACLNDSEGRASAVRRVRVVPAGRFSRRDEQPAADMQPHHPRQDRDRCVSLPPSCGSSRSMRAMT